MVPIVYYLDAEKCGHYMENFNIRRTGIHLLMETKWEALALQGQRIAYCD